MADARRVGRPRDPGGPAGQHCLRIGDLGHLLYVSVLLPGLGPKHRLSHGRSADKITVPSLPFLFVPLICWGTALLLRRRSRRIRIEHEDAWDTDRISFVEPLMADGLLGSPEALLYLDDSEHEPEPFCVPLLTLAEELPTGSDPNEHHLIRAAAQQCLLIESACRTPVDTGVLRFRYLLNNSGNVEGRREGGAGNPTGTLQHF